MRSNGVEHDDPRHGTRITALQPTELGLEACRVLGVETVGQFLDRDEQAFLDLPRCRPQTYRSLRERVDQYLASEASAPTAETGDPNRPMRTLVKNPRALKAFDELSIETVADFLACPRADFLRVRGVGERTYQDIVQRIRTYANGRPGVLPTSLTTYPLTALELPPNVLGRLKALQAGSIGDALLLPPDMLIGRDLRAVRASIDRLLRSGLGGFTRRRRGQRTSFRAFVDRVDSVLDVEEADLWRHRIGLGRRVRKRWQLAARWSVPESELAEREDGIRARMRAGVPQLIEQLRVEIKREIEAFEGVVTGKHLATGSILHAAARSSGDPGLPLRLVGFCCHPEFFVYGNFLTDIPPESMQRIRSELRRSTRPEHLPVSLTALEKRLGSELPANRRGLLLHILRDHFRLAVRIDARQGEVVEGRRSSIVERIERILDEVHAPVRIDDLVFHYREQYRSCRRTRLQDNLHSDSRFIEIEADLWSLRNLHVDELELARAEAERMRDAILTRGCRVNVRDLAQGDALSERAVYLLIDILRREPSLRNLGRGDFCPRNKETSSLVLGLMKTLRCAMGELPFSRFLQNQPERRRRLVSSLLKDNRLFVSPSPDRIDLLENYPFNYERMRRLIQVTDLCLEENDGFANVDTVMEAVQAADLGGTFLNPHLLVDVLRRNGKYEFLSDNLLAQPDIGLAGWIQHRTRTVIRGAGHPMTPQQVLAEEPELAVFQECLPDLMERDPLVQTDDGMHYQLV